MSRQIYFDRKGAPISMFEWGFLLNDETYKRVAMDDVAGLSVSTVWLGFDHGRPSGPILIFETMVFGSADAAGIEARYTTEAEALAGHRAIVERLRKNAELAGG